MTETPIDYLRESDRTMAEYSDDRSACPRCGEWRDGGMCRFCADAHRLLTRNAAKGGPE